MFTSASSKLMITAMAASSLLKLLSPGTTMSKSTWDGSPKGQVAMIDNHHRFSFRRFILSLPVLSDARVAAPSVVPESDLDFDELPAASSLLDA